MSASSMNIRKKKGDHPTTLDSTDAFLHSHRYEEVDKLGHEFNPNPQSQVTPQMLKDIRDQRKINRTHEGYISESARFNEKI